MKSKINKKNSILVVFVVFLTLSIFLTGQVYASSVAWEVGSSIGFEVKNNINEANTIGSEYSENYEAYLKLSDEEKSKVAIPPRPYNFPIDMVYEDTVEVKDKPTLFNLFGLLSGTSTTKTYSSTLPDKFDLRDEISIKVENQGSYNNCWIFGDLTALETNLALAGRGDYDFSELHVDYLTSTELDSSAGRVLHDRGNYMFFTKYLQQGKGPVLESEVPYNSTYTSANYSYLLGLEPKAYVLETVDFPTIQKANGKAYCSINHFASSMEEITEEELELHRDTIKQHIMNNGSVEASIYADIYKQKSGYYTVYTSGTVQYPSGHSISLIGWDDNFPKENFEETISGVGTLKPSKDGAYIALNSYGTSWGDNGVFYISYEDSLVDAQTFGVVNSTTDETEVTTKTVKFEDEKLYKLFKGSYSDRLVSYDDATKSIVFTDYVISQVHSLTIAEQGITNISGLENFTKLYSLDLQSNNITDITPLKALTELEKLYLSNNNISDFNPIKDLTKLRTLELNSSNVTNTDFLTNMTDMHRLALNDNSITNFSGLTNMTEIEELYLNNTTMTETTSLKNMKKLQVLDLSENSISNIEGLKDLTDLVSLSLHQNNVTDTEALKNLTYLQRLYLSKNNITNFDGIVNLTKMVDLELSETGLTSTECLKKLTNLQKLYLSRNDITDFSALNTLVNLSILNLLETNITDLNCLKNLTNLKQVNLSRNTNITDFSVIKNLTSLTGLWLHECNITDKTDLSGIPTDRSGFTVYLEGNNLFNFPDGWDLTKMHTYFSFAGQKATVSHNIAKDGNRLQLPDIFALINDYNITAITVTTNNCTIDYTTKEIVIDTSKGDSGTASITITGNVYPNYDGSIYTINYTSDATGTTGITTNYNTIDVGGKECITDINTTNNTVSQVLTLTNFPNNDTTIKAYDTSGNELTNTDKMGTGTKIEITATEGTSKTYYMFIKGDIDQNGTIDLYDILKLIELVFDKDSTYVWDEFVRLAGKCADGSLTGNPNLYDIMRLIEFQFDNKNW